MKVELQSLAIETTNVCNAKCSYCPNSIMIRPKGFMSDEIFEKIVRECKEISTIEFISMQVLGEPTLDPKLYHRLFHIRKELPKIKVYLITNGIRLTKEIVGMVDHVDVSFNYATKKEYEEGMGLSFENTIEKINSLNNVKDKISIHYVFSKTTSGHFEMLKDIFKGFDVTFNPLFNSWKRILPDLNIHSFTKRISCSMVRLQLTILWNGDIVPCCIDYDGSYLIGNVKDKSLLELFNSSYLNKLRELGVGLDYRGTFCENCNYNVEV